MVGEHLLLILMRISPRLLKHPMFVITPLPSSPVKTCLFLGYKSFRVWWGVNDMYCVRSGLALIEASSQAVNANGC